MTTQTKSVKNIARNIAMRQSTQTTTPVATSPLKGWENSLTSEEFLSEAKKMLRKKFDERSSIR